ncbi:ATPase [Bosea sp. Root381]|jgi:uncharacterized protein YndB with AHSA1/START domain|uniref:SRPBCC family protein n=1 Tax=Bosea sp. Root381 TaxID=1736524 RepID=UPI0006FADA3F|nr:SRPBCC family protein [Bosea sp. Root381]KRE15057.1 ATPase [Bosea sp. Root381]
MSSPFKAGTSPWGGWPLDREIVLSRIIDAPRSLVYAAWADPEQIQVWFGPQGMAIETKEIALRPGGVWRFDMVVAGGPRYGNRMVFLRMEEPALIEVEHGSDKDDDPDRFRMLVTFDEQSDGKTVLTLRQMHPSKERREEVIGFGAVEYGGQTLTKLALHLESRKG